MSIHHKEQGGKNMKKNYERPTVEVVKFQYRDQVIATSGCHARFNQVDTPPCVWTGDYIGDQA